MVITNSSQNRNGLLLKQRQESIRLRKDTFVKVQPAREFIYPSSITAPQFHQLPRLLRNPHRFSQHHGHLLLDAHAFFFESSNGFKSISFR